VESSSRYPTCHRGPCTATPFTGIAASTLHWQYTQPQCPPAAVSPGNQPVCLVHVPGLRRMTGPYEADEHLVCANAQFRSVLMTASGTHHDKPTFRGRCFPRHQLREFILRFRAFPLLISRYSAQWTRQYHPVTGMGACPS
jgi:hypothetical protein